MFGDTTLVLGECRSYVKLQPERQERYARLQPQNFKYMIVLEIDSNCAFCDKLFLISLSKLANTIR